MRVKILRQETADAEPRWEIFEYDGPEDNSVAGVLEYLNYNDDIRNINGERTARISWERSCLQGVCGACAMVINGSPCLACETFLKDLKGKELEIRPLTKFPVIRDLTTDRSMIQESLVKTNIYIGEYHPEKKLDDEHHYTLTKCLKCGLCLEVCPNYTGGVNFFGAVFANDCYLVSFRNREKAKDIGKTYGEHFAGGCSKSLSCMDVCPMKISTLASMAKMNRRKWKQSR